jgi:hypothetical protein
MKHTPGPWIRVYENGKPACIVPAGRPGEICQFSTLGIMEGTGVNALLISKAPEMVEALKDLLYWADYQHHKTMPDKLFPIIDKARALLNKLEVEG